MSNINNGDICLEDHMLMWDENGFLVQQGNLVLLQNYSSMYITIEQLNKKFINDEF